MSDAPWAPDTILCVHQGHELYGSDRTFISSLLALRERFPLARINVILPRSGPLSDVLGRSGFAVATGGLWVVRKADGVLGLALNLLRFPASVWRAKRRIDAASICYINTSVIFDYAVAARLSRRPVLVHVHEIPTGFAMRVVRAILRLSGATLIFNSATTQAAFGSLGRQASHVLLNGVPFREPALVREPFSDPDGTLRLLMIGRINSWKGQDLLVRAIGEMPRDIQARICLRFAGAAFGDGPAEAELRALVATLDLAADIVFEGFVDDPSELYQWADVVVVPSKKPEPFGLVAVEAMANGRPVIAADHGGLTEIVRPEITGLLVAPGSAAEWGRAIASALSKPAEFAAMGRQGREDYRRRFTEERYKAEFAEIVAAQEPVPA